MDVTTPVDRFTVRSTSRGSEICHGSTDQQPNCRRVSEREAVEASGFDVLFRSPKDILEAVGATDVTAAEASDQLEGPSVECFAATGPEIHVEWCYSSDGVLLSFLRGSSSLGWTSIEAVSVS